MPSHSLTNFEIQKYYQNEPRFDGAFSRDNLSKTIKDGAFVINLDEYADVGTYWIALFCRKNEIVYFDSFSVEHVPEETKKFIGHVWVILHWICWFYACWYNFDWFYEFVFSSPYDFEKNDSIILSYFKDKWNW